MFLDRNLAVWTLGRLRDAKALPALEAVYTGDSTVSRLSSGADWQLVRPDGDMELYARYLLKTHDGYLIQVINRVLSYPPQRGKKSKNPTAKLNEAEASLTTVIFTVLS